ncbi:MAG: MBL fold metallo-hydrolase [Conexibacteraceae bacterium]|nr:MBL fold metallo-hydrolase [Conexibacteraceae bacterium]
MLETRPGVYFWQAPHPDWDPGDDWPEVVTSYAFDDGERLLVIDPLAPPPELDQLAAGRDAVIVLTIPFHLRDTVALAQRLRAPVYAPPPLADAPEVTDATVFVAGERLPFGVEAIRGIQDSDLLLWVEGFRALVIGDTLIDRGEGLIFPVDWAARVGAPEQLRRALLPLLERDIDVVLPTHGLPGDVAALERALSGPR